MFSSGRAKYETDGEDEPLLPRKMQEDDGLTVNSGFCGGIVDDYSRRFTPERLQSDWLDDAFTWKTASSVICMFFSTFIASLALGENVYQSTKGVVGFNEYIIMNSVSGMLHSLLGCQPLLVLRPTGPITLIIEKLLQVAATHALPFRPFFAWTGMFVGLFMFLIAIFELSRHFRYVTPFADGILAMFIGIIYISYGLQGNSTTVHLTSTSAGIVEATGNVLTVTLTIAVILVALWLSSMHSSKLFTFEIRSIIVSQALTIVLSIAIPAAWWINKYYYPMAFKFTDASISGLVTTAKRPWVPDLLSLPPFGIMVAALSAVPVAIFLSLEQTIASVVCQSKNMKLQKGSYFHSSIGFVGILNFCAALVGLPFVTGSLPHSPQLVISLTDYDDLKRPTGVRENRLAPFLFYMLLCVPLLFPSILSMIPKAALNATLIFTGLQNMIGTPIFERLLLMFMEPKHQTYSHVKPGIMNLYTSIQIGLVVGCVAFTNSVGIAFPFLVASMVPFRWLVLPEWFSEADLKLLDEPQEDDALEKLPAAFSFCARYSERSSGGPPRSEDQQEEEAHNEDSECGYATASSLRADPSLPLDPPGDVRQSPCFGSRLEDDSNLVAAVPSLRLDAIESEHVPTFGDPKYEQGSDMTRMASSAVTKTASGTVFVDCKGSPAMTQTPSGPAFMDCKGSPAMTQTTSGPAFMDCKGSPAMTQTASGPAFVECKEDSDMTKTPTGPVFIDCGAPRD